jgi:hypothetical protein
MAGLGFAPLFSLALDNCNKLLTPTSTAIFMLLATRLTRISSLPRRKMVQTAFAALAAPTGPADSQHTPTAMGRWSILNKPLPAVDKIKAIHVYDFDNTRKTPEAAMRAREVYLVAD